MTMLRRSFEAIGLKLAERELPLTAGQVTLLGNSGSGSAGRNLTSQMAAMGGVGWLFATVSRITASVASTEWHLFRQQGSERIQIDDHPAMQLWKSVNPFYTQAEFIETFQQHLDLTGEAYWIILRNARGIPEEMWPIRPDRITPIPDRAQFIKGYIYKVGTEEIPLDPSSVVFLRMPHPMDPYRGLGPVQSISVDIEAEQLATQWTRNFFNNSAEPGGIIELDEAIDDAAFDRLRSRWQGQHQGIANSHRVAILERATWKDRKITQREMEFSALRKLSRDTILGAFGMPVSVMGISEGVNRANAEAGEVMFSRWVIRPRLQRIKASLNERLAPMFDGSIIFDYEDPVPMDRELSLSEAEKGFKFGIITRDEAREKMGFDKAEVAGDEYSQPTGGANQFTVQRPTPESEQQSTIMQRSPATTVKAELEEADESPLWPDAVHAERKKMITAWTARLNAERKALQEHFAQYPFPEQRIGPEATGAYDWNWYAKYGAAFEAELIAAFTVSAMGAFPGAGAGVIQIEAARWARANGGQLIKGIAEHTRNRVNAAVAHTIEQGESLNMLEKRLRDDQAFSRSRSRTIARTETARALGKAKNITAKEMFGANEKRWVTVGDDKSFDGGICEENEGEGWIPIGNSYIHSDGLPAHPNCRCDEIQRTRELHVMDGARPYKTMCQKCNKRLPVNNAQPGTEIYCPRCEHKWTVE